MRDRILALVFTAAVVQPVSAQEAHSSHGIPVVPAELLERPATLRPGIGAAHDTVTTSSPAAQKFYDQGLTYLHHFNWIEAARAFNQTLRLDRNVALAYVGLSHAYVGRDRVRAGPEILEQRRSGSSGASGNQHESAAAFATLKGSRYKSHENPFYRRRSNFWSHSRAR